MILLDTDTLGHLLAERPQVAERYRRETDEIGIAIITRIEVLQGRFATLLKAANGAELQRGQQRLDRAEHDLRLPGSPDHGRRRCGIRSPAGKQEAEEDRPGRPAHRRHRPGQPCDPGDSQSQGLPPRAGLAGRKLGRLRQADTMAARQPRLSLFCVLERKAS